MLDCLVNGQPDVGIASTDRGLRFGDGVFETIAVVDGRPALWAPHIARLHRGCERLGISPPSDAQLTADCKKLLPRQGVGVLRITVTRGSGGVGYALPDDPSPTRVLQWQKSPQRPAHWWSEGVAVRVCETRLASQPALGGIKHLNRLEQVLARAEWQDPNIAEGLMCDQAGHLIEATSCNLLIESGNALILPHVRDCGVAGVMQQWLADEAKQLGWRVVYRALTLDSLAGDDALMLCNSLIGLWPVREVEGRTLRAPTLAPLLRNCIQQARTALTPDVISA